MASGKKKTKGSQSKFWVRGPLNYNLFFAILFLNVFGIIMIYSSSYYSAVNLNLPANHFLVNQLKYIIVGLAAMWLVSKIDYHIWMKLGWLGFFASMLLVLLLKTPLGVGALGAVRWIRIGPIQFQAAEPIKLFMMVFYAMFVSRYGLERKEYKYRAWICAALMAILLAAISDNVSTAIIVLAICYVIFFVSEKNASFYIKAFVAAVAAVLLFVLLIEFVIPKSDGENFRITRIRAFLHPQDYLSSTGVQPMQALYAIGSGGFWGKGLGQSLVKFKLAEPYNDYILAIICEELGVFGSCLLLFLFAYLLLQIIKIEKMACDVEGKIFCIGVFAQVAVQTILNVMVVVNWFPTTGVTLPFISYGGASAVFLLVEFGVIFSIDNYAKNKIYYRDAVRQVDEEDRKRQQAMLIK